MQTKSFQPCRSQQKGDSRSAGFFAVALISALVVLAPGAANAQAGLLCDVTCGPDPGSANYGGALSARPKHQNARGYSSPISPRAATTAARPLAANASATLAGSQSYNYTIPILTMPGRNGLDLVLNLYYNSRLWDVDTVSDSVTFNADRDFPSYGFRLDFGYIEYDSADNQYILTESDGTKRTLPNSSSGYLSNDGSFITYNPTSGILSYKNGTTVQYLVFPSQASGTHTLFRPVWIKDSNGNYIGIAYVSGHDQLIYNVSDSLGRVVTFNYDSSNRLTSLSQQVHPSGSKTFVTFTWNTAPVLLNYSFASPLTVSNSPASGTSINVITGCTYPNGAGYKFTYGDWGVITRIDNLSSTGTTRSYVSYNYPLASAGALSDAPAYTQETISPDGANTFNWNYAVTKSGLGVVTNVTVTDPNGNIASTNLDATTGLLSSVQMQNSSATALRTVSYTWTNVGASSSPMPSNISSTLNDTGQQASLQYSYDANGNATDVYEYDFGNVLKRHTVSTFATGAYITQHLLGLPTQILVKDGSGNIVGRTDLAYDTTALTSITGVNSHDDQAYGASFTTRGNLTSVIRYSNAAGGSGGVTRTLNYDTLGNMISAQVDCCNQETLTFSNTTTYAYPDSVTRGPTSGPQFTNSFTYNIDNGLLLSRTDENSQIINYQYDSMNRLTQVSPPAPAAQTNVAFGDSSTSPTITASNTGNSLVTVKTFDGLGRLLEVDQKNGTSLISTVTSSYDGVGQQNNVSNPFAPGDTPVYTNYTYDGLGRITQASPPSGGSIQYQYSGNAATITDPAGKQRTSYTDSLGRLTEVDEPGAAFAGTNASGSVTISGTEPAQRGAAAPGPPTNGALIGYAEPSGILHFMYLANNHASDMSLNGNQYTFTDVSAAAGAPSTSYVGFTSFRDPSGGLHWAYLDSHQHITNVYKSSGAYGYQDATAGAGAPAAAIGGQLIGFAESNGTQHWAFSSGSHLYNLYWTSSGGYHYQDATAAAGAPIGGPLAGFIDSSGGLHWASTFLTGPRNIYYHALNLYDNSGSYGYNDVTALATGAPTVSSSSGLAAFGDPSGGQHWAYFAYASNHLLNVYWNACCGVAYSDLNNATGAPVGSATVTGFADSSGKQHWAYFSSGHVIHVYWNGSGYQYEDVTALSGALSAISGSPITAFADPSGGLHFAYAGATYGHLYHIYSTGSGTYTYDDASYQASSIWDAGTVSLTVGSYTATTNYGHNIGQNSTAAAVASALVANMQSQLPSSNPPFAISAPSGGATININWNSVGTAGNVAVTTTSTTSLPQYFFPSFTGCGTATSSPTQTCASALSGGQDPYSPGLPHPYATTYTYDVLDDLTGTSQAAGNFGGQVVAGQARSFSYDSMGRQLTATTPESGTFTNYYTDVNSNTCSGNPSLVCRVQDARGIVKTLTYDAINRLASISYSDGTSGQTFTYDTGGAGAFALNRLTQIAEGPTNGPFNSHTYTYDNLGRVTTVNEVIDQNSYLIRYGYNALSQITSVTYPTGRIVSQAYDGVGRVSSIGDAGATYASGLSFNAANQTLGVTYGNGVQGVFTYNDHLQISTLRDYKPGSSSDILNLAYNYGSNNNGQIQAIHYYTSPGVEDPTKSEYFSYDLWLRLSAAQTGTVNSTPGTWSLTWDYDRLGNRLHQNLVGGNTSGTSIGQPQFTVDQTTNRITNAGFTYDAAGNLTADGTNTYSYDAANRLAQVNSGSTINTYFGPLRIKKTVGSTTTLYIYAGENPIVEYVNGSLSTEYVYGGTGLLATIASGAVTYHHPDHLSDRAGSDSSGNVTRTFGHAPFGEIWYETGTADKWKFTVYERDPECGLDYATYRFYASAQGRFAMADYFSGSLMSPESLNRYAYVLNDPVNSTDPLGLAPCNMKILVKGNLTQDQKAALQKELNRILGTGGADIHATLVTSGAGDYTMDLKSAGAGGQFQFGYTDPSNRSSSDVYTGSINAIGPTTDPNHSGWPAAGPGLVYGRVFAHEMIGHGFLGYSHADPEDSTRGFLGSGSLSSANLFKGTDTANSVFSLPANLGNLLNLLCRIRTQKFDVVGAGGGGGIILPPIPIIPLPLGGGDDGGGEDDCPDGDCGPGSGWCPDCPPPVLIPRGSDPGPDPAPEEPLAILWGPGTGRRASFSPALA